MFWVAYYLFKLSPLFRHLGTLLQEIKGGLLAASLLASGIYLMRLMKTKYHFEYQH
jgi:hypothetical protein